MKFLKPALNMAVAVSVSVALASAGAPVIVPDSKALDLARQLNQAFIEVADRVSASVVVITVTEHDTEPVGGPFGGRGGGGRGRGGRGGRGGTQSPYHQPVMGEGSGVIISADGYIMTNNHVVDNAETIFVNLHDGRKFPAKVIGADPNSDIAVIKIDARNLPSATLGDSDKTRVGEFVVAIGAPFELSYSVTVGHVSAKGRDNFEDMVEDAGTVNAFADQEFIQTDASINPGNSGGPLVNLYGEVIGLNSMVEGMNRGIGFAVPINLAKRVKDHLIAEGKFTRSWLGVGIVTLRESDDYRNLIKGVSDGVVITGIEPDGPAASSNIKLGDVVVGVDGKTVANVHELRDEISVKPEGKSVRLDIVREKGRVTVPIKVASVPETPKPVATTARVSRSTFATIEERYGLTVEELDKDSARQYGVDNIKGLVVTRVAPRSPAWRNSIQEGDVIVEVNRKPVATRTEFHDALSGADIKLGAWLTVDTKGNHHWVILHSSD